MLTGSFWRFAALALSLTMLLIGCGGPARPPLAATTPFVTSVFERPSQLSVVLRPQALWNDPHWGPLAKKAIKKGRRKFASGKDQDIDQLENAEQVEFFIAISDFEAPERERAAGAFRFLFAMYALPPTSNQEILDAMTRSGVVGRKPLSSGAVEYALPTITRGTPVSIFLYELPAGTWLAVDEDTADVFKLRYEADRELPTPMAVDESLLFAAFADAEFVRASKSVEGLDRAFIDQLQDLGIVLRGGRDGIAEIVLNYRGESAAERSASAIRKALDDTCAEHRFGCEVFKAAVSDLDLSRKGATVTLRFVLSPAFLEAMLND